MKYYLTAFIISSFLTGCSNNLVFEPDKLPDGYIGQEYYVPISISGGTGPFVDLSYEILPSNSGLKLEFEEKKYYTEYIYNNFTILGKPKSPGVIVINLKGGVVASAGQRFKKEYEIHVLN
ncbi:hypothetical protein ACI3B4_000335 [Enterobacter hormaechei]